MIEPCPKCHKFPLVQTFENVHTQRERIEIKCNTKGCKYPIRCIGRNYYEAVALWNEIIERR